MMPSVKSTELSPIPGECLNECRAIPNKLVDETYRDYSLELLGLYAECSITYRQCVAAINKLYNIGE
jgi:hypothetical protein